MFYIFLAILTGMMIASQSSLNAVMHPFVGVLGVGFAAQFINAAGSLLVSVVKNKRLPNLKGMPIYCSFGGFGAIFVLGFNGLLVTYLGAGVNVCLTVSGQLFMSAVVDHFGWFGSERVPFSKGKIPGFLCILIGIFVINFAGVEAFSGIEQGWMLPVLLIFNVFVGFVTVFIRLFNYEAGKYVGKMNGSFVSAAAGSIAALVIMFLFADLRVPLSAYMEIPIWAYATGILGTAACVCNMLVYEKMKIFLATIFLLVGQIVFGIMADFFFWGSLPFTKLLGILIVSVGIFLDKKASIEKC